MVDTSTAVHVFVATMGVLYVARKLATSGTAPFLPSRTKCAHETCPWSLFTFHGMAMMQVPFVFRSATNEILYMSHLDTVNARWKYDIMWAAGLYSTYDLFFSAIDEKTREVSKSCTCSCRSASVHGLVGCLPSCRRRFWPACASGPDCDRVMCLSYSYCDRVMCLSCSC